MENHFTATQVVRITRVSYQTLNYWAKIGLVKPSVCAAHGSGSRRVYDFQDLVAISVAMKLRRAGIFGRSMVRILEVLRRAGFDSPASVALDVTPVGDVEIRLGAAERISGRRRPGQLLLDFTCDCRKEVFELRDKLRDPGTIEKLEKPRPIKKSVKREELLGEAQSYRRRAKS